MDVLSYAHKIPRSGIPESECDYFYDWVYPAQPLSSRANLHCHYQGNHANFMGKVLLFKVKESNVDLERKDTDK